MKGESRLPLNQQILQEASEWFVEFRVGDADGAARAGFDRWLRASPEHVRAYIEIAKTYVDLPRLVADAQVDVDALIARSRSSTNLVPFARDPTLASSSRRGPSTDAETRPRRRHWAVAASLLLACAVAGLLWMGPLRYPTYATDIGESRTVTLADGSSIELNARSRVRVRFSPAERDVDLIEGQALFEVAKNPSRPFVVRSGAALVRAVGTQFDVHRRDSATTVTVIEGRVAVLPSEPVSPAPEGSGPGLAGGPVAVAPRYVSAGEQIIVSSRTMTEPSAADVDAATAWIRHRLVFSGSTLNEVVEAFNRYNQRQIVIDDGALESLRVSGVYTSTDPASLIRFLREQPGVEVTESVDAVRIARK